MMQEKNNTNKLLDFLVAIDNFLSRLMLYPMTMIIRAGLQFKTEQN